MHKIELQQFNLLMYKKLLLTQINQRNICRFSIESMTSEVIVNAVNCLDKNRLFFFPKTLKIWCNVTSTPVLRVALAYSGVSMKGFQCWWLSVTYNRGIVLLGPVKKESKSSVGRQEDL